MTAPNTRAAIVMVAAIANNGVIGAENHLLWRLKSDLKHFRALTMGRPVIVGRRTFDSIGKPLPGRHMIVVTRDPGWRHAGVETAASPAEALRLAEIVARGSGEIIVAGGGEIYAALMPVADRLEITAVDLEPAGDAHFPPIDPARWRAQARRPHPKSIDDEAAFAFISYVRR